MITAEAHNFIINCWFNKFLVNNPLNPIPYFQLDAAEPIIDSEFNVVGYEPPNDSVWCQLMLQGGKTFQHEIGGYPTEQGGNGIRNISAGVLIINSFFPDNRNNMRARYDLKDHIYSIYGSLVTKDFIVKASDYYELGKAQYAGMGTVFYQTSQHFMLNIYHND